jgi:hypothetical protein
MDLQVIIRMYIRKIRPKAEAELAWFEQQPNLTAAIRMAALALNRKMKRYSHQRRIKRPAIEESLRILCNSEKHIRNCQDFSNLFTLVETELADVYGIGELYVYDTALRIGANLGVFPKEVYLHAGTRVGARKLGLDARKPSVKMSSLPAPLQTLRPHEVEDVLCIFKDQFDGARQSLMSEPLRRSWCG